MVTLVHWMMWHTWHGEIEHSGRRWWWLEGGTQRGMMVAPLYTRNGHWHAGKASQSSCVHENFGWYLWHLGAHHGVLVHGHVTTQRGVAGSTLVLHCILVHADIKALAQTAGTTLIPMCLIHNAKSLFLGLAHILPGAPNAPLEESRTAIAGIDPVMLAGTVIPANLARHMVQNATWKGEQFIVSWLVLGECQQEQL